MPTDPSARPPGPCAAELAVFRERKQHADQPFPFNIYPCTIPGDFPQVALHWQDTMELIYVKKGRGLVQAGPHTGDWMQAAAGDIFVFPPGRLHGLRQAPGQAMEYENLIFALSLLGAPDDPVTQTYLLPLQAGRLALPVRLRPGEEGWRQAAACLDAADEASRQRRPGFELAVKGALLGFLGAVVGLRTAPPEPPTADTQRLKTLLSRVEAEYAAPFPVSRAAALCGCSASHFMRWFKQMTGQSFNAFLLERRLIAAAARLRGTDDTVLAVAEAAGFDNLSHFNRQFKRRYGMTPSAYRRAPAAGQQKAPDPAGSGAVKEAGISRGLPAGDSRGSS